MKTDRLQTTKVNYMRNASDVSYLMETKRFKKEKVVEDLFRKTVTQSMSLLSPHKHASLIEKTMTGPNNGIKPANDVKFRFFKLRLNFL